MRDLPAPTGQLNSEILSIEELKRRTVEQAKASQEDISNKPKQEFTYDQLKMVWREFAFEIKKNERPAAETVFSIMTKKDPALDGTLVSYEVENEVLFDLMMRNFGEELQNYIRTKLNNWTVVLDVKVVENSDNLPKYMTGKDKYQLLSQKNINLITLQKTFNLDIEL
ncbi:MAG TPA: hypothetical protein PLP27_07750 [Crocinitomicaceae bacterium]|nr:hypothetical protein [Crocinitomicaceae bacterium]